MKALSVLRRLYEAQAYRPARAGRSQRNNNIFTFTKCMGPYGILLKTTVDRMTSRINRQSAAAQKGTKSSL